MYDVYVCAYAYVSLCLMYVYVWVSAYGGEKTALGFRLFGSALSEMGSFPCSLPNTPHSWPRTSWRFCCFSYHLPIKAQLLQVYTTVCTQLRMAFGISNSVSLECQTLFPSTHFPALFNFIFKNCMQIHFESTCCV